MFGASRNPYRQLRFLKQYSIEKGFEQVGENWVRAPDKPIALLWGINPWKRKYISGFLPEYRTAFAFGRGLVRRQLRILKVLRNELREDVVIYSWSYKLPSMIEGYAKRHGLEIYYIEDGFIRSFGLGSLHEKPLSLCFDRGGPYYDCRARTDLRTLIEDFDFATQPDLLDRAQRCIDVIRSMRLSKYNSYEAVDPKLIDKYGLTRRQPGKPKVLVTGQVESDDSIAYGTVGGTISKLTFWKKANTNRSLIIRALTEHPDGEIYFVPHPDIVAKRREQGSKLDDLRELCIFVEDPLPSTEILEYFDHVYTITSLLGFEAMIRGIPVTVTGRPFYAGWGLEQDGNRRATPYRGRARTLEEVFALAYIVYPRYIHPHTDEPISIEELLSIFCFEKSRERDIFSKKRSLPSLLAMRRRDRAISYNRLLETIADNQNYGAMDRDRFTEILSGDYLLRDFYYAAWILIRSSNFDLLARLCVESIALLTERVRARTVDRAIAAHFFETLHFVMYSLNGRNFGALPDLVSNIFNEEGGVDGRLAVAYFRCLCANIEYPIINAFVTRAAEDNCLGDNNLFSLMMALRSKPYRSERDAAARYYEEVRVTALLERNAALKFPGALSGVITSLVRSLRIEDMPAIERCLLAIKTIVADDPAKAAPQSRWIASLDRWDRAAALRLWLGNRLSRRNRKVRPGAIKVLEQRFGELRLVMRGLLALQQQELAGQVFELIELANERQFGREIRRLELEYQAAIGAEETFLAGYSRLSEAERRGQKVILSYARLLRAKGNFAESIVLLQGMVDRNMSYTKRESIIDEIAKSRFLQRTSEILRFSPQPRFPKGVVFIASHTCLNTMSMISPMLVELRRIGYAVIHLSEGMMQPDPTGIAAIDRLAGKWPMWHVFDRFYNEWRVDWPNRVVEAGRVNYFMGFYERLSTYFRIFDVDISDRSAEREFISHLKRADAALKLCNEVYNDVVLGLGLPTIILSGNSHVSPYSVFRDFCRAKDHPLLGFVNVNVAYENYFTNLGNKTAGSMSVVDMTVHKTTRSPFLAIRERFEAWYPENRERPEYREQAERLIQVSRSGAAAALPSVVERLSESRARGQKVIACYGKIPCDLGVPFDGGPAHIDMKDWINHTIQVLDGRSDFLLVVKPHPHELRPEVALDLVQGFRDLVPDELPDNVLFLGHRDIDSKDLAQFIDLAVLWNGSTGLELTAMGIPVMMCSWFGRYDYPVDLTYPDSRGQYEDYLLGKTYRAPDDELRQKAALLITYIGTEDVAIPNTYSVRQITNDKIGVPRWNNDQLEAFRVSGDPHMRIAALRCVEKFERTALDAAASLRLAASGCRPSLAGRPQTPAAPIEAENVLPLAGGQGGN